MKLFLFISLFTGSTSFATAACYSYEFKGIVRTSSNDIHVVINEKTMSEFKIGPTKEEVHVLASFINTPVKGEMIFKKKPQATDNFIKVKKIERTTTDPLHPMRDSYLRLKGEVKCP